MINRRNLLAYMGAGATLAVFGGVSNAQSSKVLRIIIGFPAGVVTDNIARPIAEELRRHYPGGVVVENRVGAGGRIAIEAVKSAADDHTLLLTPGSMMTIYPHVFRQLRYDPLADFKAVQLLASLDYAITVGPAVPASVKTLEEFIQWSRADVAARAKYGIPAAGSTSHFIGALLARETGVPFTVVPYKGGAPLLQDLLGGHIPMAIDPLPNALPHHRAGKVRILAITNSQRSPLASDLPTVVEARLNSLVASEWFGVYVPAHVESARVQKLHEELAPAVASVKTHLAKILVSTESMGPADLAALTRKELERWRGVVQATGFKVDE
jgi:tripartite-type tricarboxylate transporter receptor subunit TctC